MIERKTNVTKIVIVERSCIIGGVKLDDTNNKRENVRKLERISLVPLSLLL